MNAESVPDRPFATRTDAELDAAIMLNQSQQRAVLMCKTNADKRTLAQLKRTCAALIDERNSRDDLRTLPF